MLAVLLGRCSAAATALTAARDVLGAAQLLTADGGRAQAAAARQMSALHAHLCGAVPGELPEEQQQHQQQRQHRRPLDAVAAPAVPPFGQHQLEQPPPCGLLPPSLCGEPKFKLSLHRRGHRRTPYYVRRKELFARCKHCGQTGGPHEFFAGSQGCTGHCLRPPNKSYPKEYSSPL